MSPWRVELLRLTRTHRLLGLVVVLGFLGLAQPVFVAHGDRVLAALGAGGPAVQLPDPTVELALGGYLSQVGSVGLLVVAGVAVATLAVDARYPLAVFYRTRARSLAAVLVPRLVTTWAAVVLAFTVGLAAAAYETVVLVGAVSAGTLARAWLAGAAYLTLVVAAALLAGVLTRSVLAGFAWVAVVFMVVLPLVAMVPSLREWVPATALPGLVDGFTTAHAKSIGTELVLSSGLVGVALAIAARRPLPRH